MKKKILLLSGYDAASHRYWRNILAEQLTGFEWTQLALPDRHFYWRTRGNSLSFAFQHRDCLNEQYDLMIVTSMVDLSSLRGLCPALVKIPTIVYFHENQFSYPVNEKKSNLINVQLTSIYTALCAERLLFNSHYNLTSFLDGADSLLKRLPDFVPKGLIEKIKSRAEVLPVPVTIGSCKENPFREKHRAQQTCVGQSRRGANNNPPHIVWNHRWEYDKQPEVFFDALRKLKLANQPFRLHLLGQSFRQKPQCFTDAKEQFADEIESIGFQSKQRYFEILSSADFVVSTALHDFQGLSLQEAIISGCMPIAPRRVVYPEYLPQECLYEIAGEAESEAQNLFIKLLELFKTKERLVPDLSQYSSETLLPKYEEVFNGLIENQSVRPW